MKGKVRRGMPRALVALAAFLAFFVVVAVLLGADEEAFAPGTALEQPPGGASLTLLAQAGDQAYLVFSGSNGSLLQTVDAATGAVQASREWGAVHQAFSGGTSLFLWENSTTLVQLTPALEELDRRNVNLPFLVVGQAAIAPNGDVYVVTTTATAKLYQIEQDSAWDPQDPYSFPQPVEFLQTTPQGTLYVYAGGNLYRSADGSFDSLTPLPYDTPPLCLLGEEGFLDTGGTVCRVAEGEITPVLRGAEAPADPRLCGGNEDGFFLPESTDRLRWYSWEGEPLGSCLVDGTLAAAVPSLAVYEQDGVFYAAPTGFGPPEPTPTPSPTPAPTKPPEGEGTPQPDTSPEPSDSPESSDSPEPSETPGPTASPEATATPLPIPTPEAGWYPVPEGDIIIAPLGATVDELRQRFWPQAVEVEKPGGGVVYTGRLSTGMTVEGYTLVVPGDCDGTGTCNNRDVQAVQSHLLGEEELTGPYLRAADLNEDGEVTAEDLVLFGASSPAPASPTPASPTPASPAPQPTPNPN